MAATNMHTMNLFRALQSMTRSMTDSRLVSAAMFVFASFAHARNCRFQLAFGIHEEQRARDDLLAFLHAVEYFVEIVAAFTDLEHARFEHSLATIDKCHEALAGVDDGAGGDDEMLG